MSIRMNISMVGIVGRSVKSCCLGSSWALRIGIVSATLLLFANAGQAQWPTRPDGVGSFGACFPERLWTGPDNVGYYWLGGVGTAAEAEKANGPYIQNRSEVYRAYTQKRENSRHSAEAPKIAEKSSAAEPLSADLLNSETGKIVWPKALLDSKFTAKRTEIEKLFELRAQTSGGPNSQTKIQVATGELAALLKTNATTTNSTDYMKARKFLDSLAVSAS